MTRCYKGTLKEAINTAFRLKKEDIYIYIVYMKLKYNYIRQYIKNYIFSQRSFSRGCTVHCDAWFVHVQGCMHHLKYIHEHMHCDISLESSLVQGHKKKSPLASSDTNHGSLL
jgi:sarcosine oxidase delta subunit